MLTVFDLFSGGGGFRQGAENAGMEIIAHCEIDKWAEKFYTNAFNTENEVYFNDATKINTGELPNFDVLLAGFPCQAFSIAGKRRGFEDSRGTMFFEVARFLKDKRPKYFILENVKGLLNHDGGKTFQTILRILSDLGIYSIEWALLNSKHFGVPQNRERVFIVGYPRERGIGKIFPLATPTGKGIKQHREVEQIGILASNNKANKIVDCCNTLDANYFKGGVANQHRCLVGTYRTHKVDGSGQPVIYQAGLRRLTPLECFRLQGFSDEVFKNGSQGISDAQLYKIAGNSVTVNVVYEIAKKIVEMEKG